MLTMVVAIGVVRVARLSIWKMKRNGIIERLEVDWKRK